ncbi:hypothetical protein BCR35DRAFT_350932, partial [Leucosporidium creatinivorum]
FLYTSCFFALRRHTGSSNRWSVFIHYFATSSSSLDCPSRTFHLTIFNHALPTNPLAQIIRLSFPETSSADEQGFLLLLAHLRPRRVHAEPSSHSNTSQPQARPHLLPHPLRRASLPSTLPHRAPRFRFLDHLDELSELRLRRRHAGLFGHT